MADSALDDEPPPVPSQEGGATSSSSSADADGGPSRIFASAIGGGGGAAAATAPVPDVLLSLAKDDRYISEVTSLLSQVAVSFASLFLPPRRGDGGSPNRRGGPSSASASRRIGEEILDDGGRRFVERLRPELTLLASFLVHSATFVCCSRNFGDSLGGRDVSIQRSLGMESLNLGYRYPARKSDALSSSSTPSERMHPSNGSRKHASVVSSSWGINRWHVLLFFQTIVPYVLNRVGRGGWSRDLGGLRSTLMARVFPRPIENNIGTGNGDTREGEDTQLRNDDRLRGSARRRLFDEQRRRMLSQTSGNLDVDPEGREISSEVNGDGASQADHRSQTATSTLATSSWAVMNRIYLAISSLSHGAHTLPRHGSTASRGDHLDRYANIIKWFLRLHLALFYWNGTYPTIAHRLTGAKICDDVPPLNTMGSSSGAIVANRPTYKPISALILIQTAAALARTFAEASVEVAHFCQVSYFRWRRRNRMLSRSRHGRPLPLGDSGPLRTSSERAEYMDLIEGCVPGISSSKMHASNSASKTHSRKQRLTGTCGSDIHPCGICLNKRVNPAAPSVCGHVFCWNCILHWVSNIRSECPMCRAKTRPQDIIPLHNYP
ncbi:hypothetical protein ACHAWF_002671 [Thalassiosira exigua]